MYAHAADHRGYFPLAGDVINTPPGMTPDGVADATRQRYDYFINNGNGIRVTALPHALSIYLGVKQLTDTTYTGVENQMAVSPLLDLFLCPADIQTAEAAAATPNPGNGGPRWVYDNSAYLTGYSSYDYNEEVLGFNTVGSPAHTRLRGLYTQVPRPSDTMLMCDGNCWHQSQHQTFDGYAISVTAASATMADFFNLGTCQQEAFDPLRHRGKINILYVDGHVDTQPILASGNWEFPFVDPTVGSMFFPNGASGERPSGYSGGSVGAWKAPFAASNVITGGTNSGGGLAGVGLDVDFH